MITINVLPPELKKKQKKKFLPGGMNLPIEVVIGSAGGLLFLLIMLHVGLLVTNITKMKQHKLLKQEWASISPQKENADAIVNQMRELDNKHKAIAQVMEGTVIHWAPKLNAISDNVPRGVWLSKIALNDEMFFIEGSAISRRQNEMINVHTFTANLKKQALFYDQLTELDLGSIQRRSLSKMDVADFLITTKIKSKIEEGKNEE